MFPNQDNKYKFYFNCFIVYQQKENRSLKDEVSVLQQDVSTMEDQYDQQLQRTMHEAELSHAEDMTREQRSVKHVTYYS